MRTGELTEKVLNHFGAVEGDNTRKYITLTQVRAATGWADPTTADVMVMGNWPSSGNELEGIEVKVSRADWLNEVKNPRKGQGLKKYCNRWWLVIADEAMVKEGELPEDWGMMVLYGNKLKVVKQAPELGPEPLSNLFVASMLRSDASETVPLDVHKDQVKDAVREAEAKCKEKYRALLNYVKFLNKELGINIEIVSESEWSNGSYKKSFKEWAAKVPRNWNHNSAEQVVELIKVALSKDLDRMREEMDDVKRYANKVIEIHKESLTYATEASNE